MTTTVILTIGNDPDAPGLAQQLLRRGCRVAVTGPDLRTLLDAVRGYGAGRATVLVGDVDDPAEVARMHSAAQASLGPIDIVIGAQTASRTSDLAPVYRLPTRLSVSHRTADLAA